MLKKLRNVIILLFALLAFTVLFSNPVNASSGSLYLDKLDFEATINSDGSMDVVETWEIDIRYTNTLYKTFELDEEKFSEITNVKVVETTDGIKREFTQINQEMYHVTQDCYYGLINSNGDFEIAWGVGLDNSYDTRTYEISYTVTDAIGKYNDYAELYWQFIGADFEIDADEVTGTIILPDYANSTEDIKVWGHTQDLNGEIYVTALDKIKFRIQNFSAGNYVEVRSLFPTEMITTANRTYNEDRYDEVLTEETKWANQANLRRVWEEIEDEVIGVFFLFVVLALCIIFIKKAVKYGRKLSESRKYVPEQNLEYFRDLPEKDVTPGEALYILEEPYNTFYSKFGKIFSATLLDLKLKGYIDLRVEKNRRKEKIYIQLVKETNDGLKEDEISILEFIKKAIKGKEEIELKELEKYIKSNSIAVEGLINRYKKLLQKQLSEEGILDKEQEKEYLTYKNIIVSYYLFAFIILFISPITFPLAIVLLIDGILCSKANKKINVLTQKGVNEKEKWKGLKKYMEDFSLLNEKEVPAIEIWERYLVYATAFGIADKVLKQLKTIYPNIDEFDGVNTSSYMYFMYHSNFSSSFSHSINSSISSAHSSASGGGGGFSGGGGGGRWPEEVEEADNASFLKI